MSNPYVQFVKDALAVGLDHEDPDLPDGCDWVAWGDEEANLDNVLVTFTGAHGHDTEPKRYRVTITEI